jgi:hypothetical protein
MKKIMQTKFGKDGNCLAACIASLLDIDINSIPELPYTDEWADVLNEWLTKEHNLLLITINSSELPKYLSKSIIIACGYSERNLLHAVLFQNGKFFHDPHPDGTGIKEVKQYDILVRFFKE